MSWRDDALQHALDAGSHEACGLVIVARGRERYRPCRNIAAGPDEHFVIHPEDWAAAEDAGEVVAVFHSHPGVPSTPSDGDRAGCEAGGVPWHIVGLPFQDWATIEPAGYRAPLIGREFTYGRMDCYTLIRDWYATQRGIELPDFPRRDGDFLAGVSHYENNFAVAGFAECCDGPREGDILLMRLAAQVPDHGAVYIGDDTILHHLQGRLSSRDRWDGFLRERTVKVLRHAGSATLWRAGPPVRPGPLV